MQFLHEIMGKLHNYFFLFKENDYFCFANYYDFTFLNLKPYAFMFLNSDALQKLRKANLSQENMSDMMKIEQSSYSRLENGKTKIKMEHIPKIAEAIKKTSEEVLSSLTGCTVHNTNNDNAQNNQALVINLDNQEYIKMLLAEKDKRIEFLEKLLATQNS